MRKAVLGLLLLVFASFGQDVIIRQGVITGVAPPPPSPPPPAGGGVAGAGPYPGGYPGAPVAAAPETKPEDRGAVEGQVFDAATGEPLKKANLVLRRVDAPPNPGAPPPSYSLSTDDGGKFSMKDIDPGRYRLTVNRTGYVNAEYGARGPGRPGTTLTLGRAQVLKDLHIRMTPHAVISGRVLDADREPLAYVSVQAMRYRYINGRRQLTPGGQASTNDLGEYRIFGLPPGRYYLSAVARNTGPEMMFSADRSPQQAIEEGYVPTYYPGVTDPSGAAPLDVAAGSQLTGMELRLSKTRTVRVRGRVVNATGVQGRQTMVMLVPKDRSFIGSMMMGNGRAVVDPRGVFELRGVAPGSYVVTASLYDSNRSYVARYPIEVGSTNVEDVALTINQGFEIQGAIRIDGEATTNLSSVRVNLGPREPGVVMVGGFADGSVTEQGTFTLLNVNPDVYNVNVVGLPDGFYVKSVRVGQDNTDVRWTGLDLTRGPLGPLEVVISPKAGQVSGSVTNDKPAPVPGATVVLIPQEKERREAMQAYKTITTDQSGRFTLKNIEPGEYKLYAWEDMEPGAYMDPDLVKPVEGRGEAVSVQEGSSIDKQIKVIAAE
jgi:hypothetical protein